MDKERSIGLSLRKKRGKGGTTKGKKPVIGAPRQVPMPAGMAGARLETVHPPLQVRSRDKEKVADLVKRRMSTRFPAAGETHSPPSIPSIPDMLSIPAGEGARLPPPADPVDRAAAGQALDVDISIFREPSFDAEQFVSTVLANASDDEIHDFQRKLKDIRNRTSSDLQKNVFVNRTQFILISKEIDKLRNEMRVLRTLLTDLHSTTGSLRTENSLASSANDAQIRKNANRSSVADLTALHMSHLQALWKQVEGAQKFLPSIPGRHIILESRHWVELNAATWKPRRIVHMVLLNDHLLIATVKKKRVEQNAGASTRGSSPQIKNVADKCWGLADIEIVDLTSDAPVSRKDVSGAINLRVGKESFVYQNDDSLKKAELLRQFKKSRDELRKALRAETEDSLRRRDSVSFFAGRDPKLLEHGDLLNSLSAYSSGTPMFTVEGQSRNLRWVESQMDDLDVDIAHRRFDEAVMGINKLRAIAQSLSKNNVLVSELINLKLDERASKLASIIIAELVQNTAQKTTVKKNIHRLVKLDYEDRARETYLEARSNIITKRTRQVSFEGDLSLYISQVALVQFSLIRNTVEIYNSCFDYRLASSLVKWANQHITSFIKLLDKQLKGVDPGSKAYQDCMEIVRIHSTMLVDCGLDFMELKKHSVPSASPASPATTTTTTTATTSSSSRASNFRAGGDGGGGGGVEVSGGSAGTIAGSGEEANKG